MTRESPSISKSPASARQRGLALVVVLWAAVLLALIAGGVTRLSRGDLNLARNLAEGAQAELAADSALWTAVYRIVSEGPQAWPPDGTVYAWRFGDSEVRVRVTDELGRIDINAAPPELLAALFVAADTAPEEATGLADAVVEFRNQGSDNPDDPDSGGRLNVPFALIDSLEQVPGMPPELQSRIADAITVYTGEARPRPGSASPLVLAAIQGRPLDEAEGDPANEPANEAQNPTTAEPQVIGDSPVVLNAPAEPMTAFSGLLHIKAEAVSAGGSHFAREAVVALERRKVFAYRLRLWRRGARVLFPASDQAR
jgi:general secretion pathway protein K